MKTEIEKLVVAKGFYNRKEGITKKLLFAFIDLGEARDAWEKGETQKKITKELVYVIFCVLVTTLLSCPSVNMDEIFKKRLERKLARQYQHLSVTSSPKISFRREK